MSGFSFKFAPLKDHVKSLCMSVAVWLAIITSAAAENMALVDVLERLRDNGHDILYSSELVSPAEWIEIGELTLSGLREALLSSSLELQRVRGVWVITRRAEPLFAISGSVSSDTSDPIRLVQLLHRKSGRLLSADDRGRFELSRVAVGDVIDINAPGFLTTTLLVDSARSYRVVLSPEQPFHDVIVYGSVYHLPGAGDVHSPTRLSMEEMKLTPAFGGDTLRVLSQLPGIASVGVSARPHIRGGDSDEVLVLLDGVELLEPFHLADFQGGFSSIDHRTVDSIDVYTGGFPVRYGNRMSGVIDIRTNEPRHTFDTEFGYSNFSTFINTRGRASGERDVGWLLSARRGDLEELTQFLDTRVNNPEYSDVVGRVELALDKNKHVSIGGLTARDDIRFDDIEESASSKITSDYVWARLDTEHNTRHSSAWILSFSHIDREKFGSSDIEDNGKGGQSSYTQRVKRILLQGDHSLRIGSDLYEFGVQMARGSTDYRLQSNFNRGDVAVNLGGQKFLNENIIFSPDGWAGGAYVAAEYSLGDWLLQPSVRWDFQDYDEKGHAQQGSPRLGIAYDATEDLRVSLSVGRFYQPEGLHELQVVDGVTVFSRAQSTDQAVWGIDWLHGKADLRAEVWHKRYRNPKPRFENLFNPFVLLPELEPDRVRLDPSAARSSGVDVVLGYQLTEELRGQVQYGYMDARDKLNGKWVSRRWSQRHSVRGQLSWEYGRWTAAVAAGWHSGWRTSLIPSNLDQGTVLPIENTLNNFELRDYFSLDVGVNRSWQFRDMLVTVNVDVLNATERKNLAGIDFDIDDSAVGSGFTFERDRETLQPLVYSASLVISF